jgi:hypothetical protein
MYPACWARSDGDRWPRWVARVGCPALRRADWRDDKTACPDPEMLWGERRGNGTIVALSKPTGVPYATGQ